MRQEALSAVKAGITRLRDKGGASKDSLYDLLNGYVTAARTVKMRPGSRIDQTLPSGTKGLVYFQGKFVVFANIVIGSASEQVEVEVLKNPVNEDAILTDIHFAMPFLGYLYVVAEFDNGDVYHYWLEKGETWSASKTYLPGALVQPSDPNGLAYRLVSDTTGYTPWAANVARQVGDVVVPTTDNGIKYTVTETSGSGAKSGTTEPEWPTNDGETIFEDANVTNPLRGSSTEVAPQPPAAVIDRYGRVRGTASQEN